MNSQKEELRSGIVAIIGRPNVGKSTLLNKLLGEKVAIVSPVPQTTRMLIRGILNDPRGQVVFVDTPGMHLSSHKLGRHMTGCARQAIAGCDIVIHLVDVCDPPGEEEDLIVEQLRHINIPIILGFNKIDLKGGFISQYIQLWENKKKKPVSELVDTLLLITLSGLKGINTGELLEIIFSLLPKGPALYPEDIISDFPQKLSIAEIIREKLFQQMRQEIPHSLAVLVEEMAERSKKLTYIRVNILVERDSQKTIVVGKDGKILKNAGERSRKEIENILGKKVYLDLWVKVEPDWRQNTLLLKRLGYI